MSKQSRADEKNALFAQRYSVTGRLKRVIDPPLHNIPPPTRWADLSQEARAQVREIMARVIAEHGGRTMALMINGMVAQALKAQDGKALGRAADIFRANGGTYAELLAMAQKEDPNLTAEEFESLMYEADEAESEDSDV